MHDTPDTPDTPVSPQAAASTPPAEVLPPIEQPDTFARLVTEFLGGRA